MILLNSVSKNVLTNLGLTLKIPQELVFLDVLQTLTGKIIHVNVLQTVLFGKLLPMIQQLFVSVNVQLILLLITLQ